MTKTFAGCCSALLVVGLQASPLLLGSAQAAQKTEAVTVDGPYIVREQTTKRAISGEMPEKTISVSQHVNYSDLDLSKPADADQLRARVKAAAKDSCRELNRRYPSLVYIPVGDARNCAKDATSQALARVDAIVSQSVARAGAPQTVARADIPVIPSE